MKSGNSVPAKGAKGRNASEEEAQSRVEQAHTGKYTRYIEKLLVVIVLGSMTV